MLPANLSLKAVYDSTVDFFSRSPTFSLRGYSPADSDSDYYRSPVESSAKLREKLEQQAADRHRRWNGSSSRTASSTASSTIYSSMRPPDTRSELTRTRAEVARLDERCRLLERTLRDTKDLLRARDQEVTRLRRELQVIHRRRSDDQHRIRGGGGEWQEPPSHKPAVPRSISVDGHVGEWAETRQISAFEEQRANTRSFEAFLTKTDNWSGAQVIQAVNDLNSEILQFAASATDISSFDKRLKTPATKPTQALQDTSERIGPHLTKILSTRDHTQDPILVQLALQGGIATCIARALASFCMGMQPQKDTVLSQMYSHIYVSEPQPTSAKWRSIAHRYIHTMHPNLTEHTVNDLSETVMRACLDIFTVAGCTKFESSPFSKESLRGRFGEQILRIAQTVAHLEQVVRQEIMSTNMDIISIERSENFDFKTMTDAFGEYAPSRGVILCTNELGLRCTTRKGGTESTGNAEDMTFEQRVLLQPKVVLESVLDVLHDSKY